MSAISRVRESSPTESASSHQTGSDSHPSHPVVASNVFTAPGEKPLSEKDLQRSKESMYSFSLFIHYLIQYIHCLCSYLVISSSQLTKHPLNGNPPFPLKQMLILNP